MTGVMTTKARARARTHLQPHVVMMQAATLVPLRSLLVPVRDSVAIYTCGLHPCLWSSTYHAVYTSMRKYGLDLTRSFCSLIAQVMRAGMLTLPRLRQSPISAHQARQAPMLAVRNPQRDV